MSSDYFDRGPKATVQNCDPATMDHPLHSLVGMRRAGWWVLTLHGCIGDVFGPYPTQEEATECAKAWLDRKRLRRAHRPANT